MRLLGIETSCDETAVAIVTGERKVLAHRILSQDEAHRPYGGVVPEIAARAHMEALDRLTRAAMEDAGIARFEELDGIAVTGGPGLIGGVIVGVMMAKAIASVAGIPFIPVNHLEGHALTARLTEENLEFPFLLLLVSGGHCQLILAEEVGHYTLLGQTLDDALGECFDKVAKMLGLGYPGGPKVEQMAKTGNPERFAFPRSLVGRDGCDFSFSGLKTAVRRAVEALNSLSEQDKADICASFQHCAGDILADRVCAALKLYKNRYAEGKTLVVAGGVAANLFLKQRLTEAAAPFGVQMVAPPLKLCTDNAAMIAWAGIEHLRLGHRGNLAFDPRPRWPLVEMKTAYSA